MLLYILTPYSKGKDRVLIWDEVSEATQVVPGMKLLQDGILVSPQEF